MRPDRRRRTPLPASEMIVRYSASELPNATVERLQKENAESYTRGETTAEDAFRIANLLLTLTLHKLEVAA